MRYYKYLLAALFAIVSFVPNLSKEKKPKYISEVAVSNNSSEVSVSEKIELVYNSLDSNHFDIPTIESFSEALEGFYELKENGLITKDVLTIVDFSLSSKQKRFWVIDMVANKIIFNSLVAHGKNSGDDYATNFSNVEESNKSSLGFYATAETYFGQHGLSLKLDGLEKGINDKARKRAVVIHGAEYVSTTFVKNHNRLGRSQGCPALPIDLSKKIIETIKDKSCLFIYHPSRQHSQKSILVS